MKRVLILVGFIISVMICSFYLFIPTEPISTTIFKVENGFGYMISSKEKILIKQKNIPVIQEQRPFCSEKDAQKIATLIKKKLIHKKSPSITLKELEQQEIHFDCVDLH